MPQNIIEEYLKEKKIQHKPSGYEQFAIKECPACGDTKYTHCYINQLTGLWDCKKCGNRGNFNQFRELYGDAGIDLTELSGAGAKAVATPRTYRTLDNVLADDMVAKLFGLFPDHLKYLTEGRKLTEETIKHFRVGSNGDKISIPVYKDGKLVNVRYRRNPAEKDGAKYTQERNCKAELFNGDIIENEKPEEVFIVEGEFDAMMLWQQGIKNVVSTTLGAGYFPKDWVERLKDVKKFYICYDTDAEGEKGLAKVSGLLGEEKCVAIKLPDIGGKKTDVTDYFNSGKTKADFDKLVTGATPTQEEEIIHISELTPDLRERILTGETYGIPTGYEQLDSFMGGLRKGRMIIVSGLTSTGKSSFATCVSLQVAEMKTPILYYSLEMPPIDLAKRFLMIHSKLTGEELKNIEDPSPELQEVDKTILALAGDGKQDNGMPIYFYNGSGMIKFQNLEDSIKTGIEKYGVGLVVIDHLHYFAHNYSNLTNETSMIVRKIKQLAVANDVPIMLLAHLNRGGRSSQRKGLYTPSLSDLRDTGAIEQDADQVLFVCRDSENEKKEEREKAWIKIAKNRDGATGRSISAVFSEDITYFEEQDGVSYEEEAKAKAEEKEATLDENDKFSGITF